MAIIDRKLDEDAQRQARAYAERNDASATNDWDQPPPAYEDGPQPSTSRSNLTSQPSQSESGTVESLDNLDERRQRRIRRQREMLRTESDDSDETLPLLSRRQKLFLKKRLRARDKVRKGLHFIGTSLLLSCIALLVLKLTGLLEADNSLPDPPEADGKIVDYPKWSKPVKTDPAIWPKPYSPIFTSHANFTFSAFNEFFLHAKGGGSSYSGRASINNVGDLTDEEVIKYTGGTMLDEIFVSVEAQFSEVSLRDGIRVNKMQINDHKEGMGIYGKALRHQDATNSFIAINVDVFVPSGKRRTEGGLADDESSFLPEIEVDLDNMRLGVENMHNPDMSNDRRCYATVGRLKANLVNGGATFIAGFVANESFSINLRNGQIGDIMWTPVSTVTSPRISITTVNGPIWLHRLVAMESIYLKTVNGGINITDVAIAPSIKIKHDSGITGGAYRTNDLYISGGYSPIDIDVDLRRDIFEGESVLSGKVYQSAQSNEGVQCQKKQISIHGESGGLNVRYHNHQREVLLDSSIVATSGKMEIDHDSGFEGTFDAQTEVGPINVGRPMPFIYKASEALEKAESGLDFFKDIVPHQAELSNTEWMVKRFILNRDSRSPYGRNAVTGRTWWNYHRWEKEETFCKSSSFVKNDVGTTNINF